MPTKKQLHFVWGSQFRLFGGSGLPKQHYAKLVDDHGLTTTKSVDIPLVRTSRFKKSKGKKIGEVIWDGGDLHIVRTKK